MRRLIALTILTTLALAACHRRAPAPVYPTAPAISSSGYLIGDPAQGAQLWREKQCAACHGMTALGGIGKPLADTALTFDMFLSKIRNAIPPKPAMSANDLSDADAYSIYLWLHTLPAEPAKGAPLTPAPLPTGQVLGIQLWTQYGCQQCHGAFAQGGAQAPALAGETYPFERERAVMRQSADQNPAHSEKNIPDDVLRRLLDWLRRGADLASGC
jgi:mono/diheme cytochrome c family protein